MSTQWAETRSEGWQADQYFASWEGFYSSPYRCLVRTAAALEAAGIALPAAPWRVTDELAAWLDTLPAAEEGDVQSVVVVLFDVFSVPAGVTPHKHIEVHAEMPGAGIWEMGGAYARVEHTWRIQVKDVHITAAMGCWLWKPEVAA